MSGEPLEAHDAVVHFWCPMLGQTLNFGYCRRCQDGLPCSRVLTCFQSHFDVAAFLEAHFSPDERARCLAPPPSRMQRVADALAQAETLPKQSREDQES